MVHIPTMRVRQRPLGRAPRLRRSRSFQTGTKRPSAIVGRYPRTAALFEQARAAGRHDGAQAVAPPQPAGRGTAASERSYRRVVNEGYVRRQLEELAKAFPGSRFIEE